MRLFDRFFKSRVNASPKKDYAHFDLLIAQSMEELRLKTQAHDGAWRISEAAWSVDQDAGTLTFTLPSGIVAICSVQIIGTRNDVDGSFLWGWDHPSVSEPLQQHARTVRAFGETHGYEWLTTPMLQCPEDKAWQLTALACKLNEAQGAYRGPAGNTAVFMTFDNIVLTQSADA